MSGFERSRSLPVSRAIAGALLSIVALPLACAREAAPKSIADVKQVPFELAAEAIDASTPATPRSSSPGSAMLFGDGHRIILNNVGEDGTWPLALADAQAADGPLLAFLQSKRPDIALRLADYDGQFWGERTDEGRAILVLNFFCRDVVRAMNESGSSRLDWTVDRIEVKDGGKCFFRAYFDSSANVFVGLDVNGDA